MKRSGILFVISAPSGGGKSTLLKQLTEADHFVYSISCTTRAPRPGEVNGTDYHFLTVEEFKKRVDAGEFLEHAEVHGNFYGTLRKNVEDSLAEGRDVLMDVDIQGAAQIKTNADPALKSAIVDVFLMPENMEILQKRLNKRGTETPEQLAVRLRNAEVEMAAWIHYRYRIISGSPEDDLNNFRAIMQAERMRTERLKTS